MKNYLIIFIYCFLFVTQIQFCFADELIIYSDQDVLYKDGSKWKNAVESWMNPKWISIEGAKWIWSSYLVQNPMVEEIFVFQSKFNIPENADLNTIQATIDISADNRAEITLNNKYVGYFDSFTSTKSFDLKSIVEKGENIFEFQVKNYVCSLANCNSEDNPAGFLFKAVISYELLIDDDDDNDNGGSGCFISAIRPNQH